MALPVLEVDLGRGVHAFFTTRDGGASVGPYTSLNLGLGVADDADAVRANRARVAARAGAPVAFAIQVHGADLLEVHDLEAAGAVADSVGTADALLTTAPGVALGVLVADCVPVLIAGRTAGGAPVLATAHVGRAGLMAGVVPAAVSAVAAAGGADVRAALGPAICGRCYEVPATLRDEIAEAHPDARCETSWGTPSLDLRAAAATQLTEAGAAVVHVAACAREDRRFFSFRRDGVTGRCAGVIATRREPLRPTRQALV